MHRFFQKFLAVVVLAAGLTMLVWGWRAFAKVEPAAPLGAEEGLRMCPPTLGEIIGSGSLGRKLGYLVVALVGMGVTGGSFLMLIRRQEEA